MDEGNEKVAREKMPLGEGVLLSRNFSARFHVRVGRYAELADADGSAGAAGAGNHG